MPPLARSLLALGALLSADALVWKTESRPGCKRFKMLLRRDDGIHHEDIRFHIRSAGDDPMHKIPDHCAKHGVDIQYQTVEVCNDYKGLSPSRRKAPKVHWMSGDTLSPVYASCEGAPQCGPLVLHVSQRCIPAPLM